MVIEKFDFSKEEDSADAKAMADKQKKFDKLPEKEQGEIVDEEQKETVKNKKINIPEIGEITYLEKTVMFPKHIIEKTGGVKGYVRKTFDKEIIDSAKQNNQKWNKDIGECDIGGHARDPSKPCNLLAIFYKELTNGNFPYKTYNHIMPGYRASLEKSLNLFRREKLLLQEIASEKSFYSSVYQGGGVNLPFKIENNTQVLNKESPNLDFSNDDFRNSSLYKELKQSSNFLFLPEGLDVMEKGQIWPGKIEKVSLFGFGTSNKIFQKYLKESEKIISNLTVSHEDFDKQGNILNYRRETYYLEYFLKDLGTFKEGALHSIKCLSGLTEDYRYCLRQHPSIPLIINHPDILNLRWCHADYAAFPTKRGYNVIEMIT